MENNKKNSPYWVIGLFLVLLSLANIFAVEQVLNLGRQDSAIINISGKQRMLSQQIKSLFLLQQLNPSTNANARINESFNQWKKVHQSLTTPNNFHHKYVLNQKIRAKIQILTPYISNIESLISSNQPLSVHQVNKIVNNQDEYLHAMDIIISDIQLQLNKRFDQFLVFVIGLCVVSILLISLGYRFYFSPIIKDLLHSKEMLESKNVQLERFAYIASHDLKEPLRTVSSFSNLIQREYDNKLDENATQYFNYINKATLRMTNLIDGLLHHSRIRKTEQLIQLELNKIIIDVLEDIHLIIKEKHAKIHVDALPTIIGMEVEIRQVFQNLILNAIKFAKKDTSPYIEISAEEKHNHWIFCIKDNGIGIELEQQHKIFGFFSKIHQPSQYEGSGIGLAFCQKIIELHDGKIWVESELGEGSTFYFSISKKLTLPTIKNEKTTKFFSSFPAISASH